jgi:DNA repair protein RecN (Recombination protein N)
MLRTLIAKDFAIIESVDLALHGGMTVLTGETGAGKSLMVDALMLLSGVRADVAMIRSGCERAELSAEFDLARKPEVLNWLKEQELNEGESTDCHVRRTLRVDGTSRAFVNGRAVTLAHLRQLADQLLEIHGQHEYQALLQPARQRQLLDAFGDHQKTQDRVSELASTWRQIEKQIKALSEETGGNPKDLDSLQFQIDELNRFALSADAYAALENEHQRLAHQGELIERCERAHDIIDGDDQRSVRRALNQALNELEHAAKFDSSLITLNKLLGEASVQVEEAARMLDRYRSKQELDPSRYADIDRQILRLHDLSRKHRVPVHELAQHLVHLKTSYERLSDQDRVRDELKKQQQSIEAAYQVAAGELTRLRQRAAEALSVQITQALKVLGMPDGRFDIQVTSIAQSVPQSDGVDQIDFLVSANAGQALRPLRKVASGGELSRLSLAIEVAILGKGDVPTMVFDEVDSGIGGAVAEIVGKKLRALGQARQVLCVTHLPQVAAQANHHVKILKVSDGAHTRTKLTQLNGVERVEETSRMLGGVQITEQMRASAREMLEQAAVE